MISLRRKIINKCLIESLKDIKEGKVLDVGSERYGNRFLLNNFKGEYITVDIDRKANPDVIASVEDLPFKDNNFDIILCLEVLEHVKVPEKAINEMRRVLKKNGKLIISIPFLTPIHMEEDYRRLTKKGVELLLQNKFSNVKIKEMGNEEDSLLQVFFMLYRKRFFFFFYPVIYLILKILGMFKCKGVHSTTGYFAEAIK